MILNSQAFIKGKWSSYLYLIWSPRSGKPQIKPLFDLFYIHYLLIFTTSYVKLFPSYRKEWHSEAFLPDLCDTFHPVPQLFPHLGDKLAPSDAWGAHQAWLNTSSLLIGFSLGHRRKWSLTLMNLLRIKRDNTQKRLWTLRTVPCQFKWNYCIVWPASGAWVRV